MSQLVQDSNVVLPFAFARRNLLMADGVDEQGKVRLLCQENTSPLAIVEAQRLIGRPVRLTKVDEDSFNQSLNDLYSGSGSQSMQAAEEIGTDMDLGSLAESLSETEDLLEQQDDAPIIRLINAIMSEAVKENASDIHIETYEKHLIVRFRVDGVLREVLRPRRALAPLLTSRIKVMAKLDIAEKRIPQDGRIALRLAGREVDVRVSTLPSNHGERVVMRLLDKQAGRLDLTHLGMRNETLQRLQQLINRPHGILLVTGPTGSGKTTTLYAALQALNDRSRNILTVEDPIEYSLPGIGQTQVNTKADMTFARGLRAILRQDPDVVMIGEIRDYDTVEIAVQASLTGHLVLSTLHTNSAVGAITRLNDMGVEPFLLSSSLIGVLAQRLVRRLCPDCKDTRPASEAERAILGLKKKDNAMLCHPVGCPNCNQTGYRGRMGVYELLSIDEELRQMIHDRASEIDLAKTARKQSRSIVDDGYEVVLMGDTTLEEVLRVARG